MIKIRNLAIGSGTPKICAPLSSPSLKDLVLRARRARSAADLVEWRADYYDEIKLPGAAAAALAALRGELGNMPLLFTLRTSSEGGAKDISLDEYVSICKDAVNSGCADLIDAELSLGDNVLSDIIRLAKQNGMTAVVSSHNFELTPSPGEMLSVLTRSRDAGAGIAKLAVTPRSAADVLALLTATEQFSRDNPGFPIITMAMGELGKISRVSGGIFGSSVTFASIGSGTAPGQLTISDTRRFLELLEIK